MDGMDHNKQQVEIDVMRSATHPQTNHNQSKHGNEKESKPTIKQAGQNWVEQKLVHRPNTRKEDKNHSQCNFKTNHPPMHAEIRKDHR